MSVGALLCKNIVLYILKMGFIRRRGGKDAAVTNPCFFLGFYPFIF
jgi:hypothetical protein